MRRRHRLCWCFLQRLSIRIRQRMESSVMNNSVRVHLSAWDLVNRLHSQDRRLYASMQKLASGLAINTAADGPAMLIISERLRSQIASLEQRMENLSALQHKYEYGASTALHLRSQLVELRSLAVGAANESVNDEAMQAAYDQAAQHVKDSYNHVVETAQYNGKKLFDGSDGALASLSRLEDISLMSADGAAVALATVDRATAELDQALIDMGATEKNELESQQASLAVRRQNLIAAESEIRDVDYAQEWSRFIADSIRQQVGLALMAHAAISAKTMLSLFE